MSPNPNPSPARDNDELPRWTEPAHTDALLSERGKTHGDFTDHARITQTLKRVMAMAPNWKTLSDVQRESLEMQAHKIGRILAGDPAHRDHWDDIAGYARLAADRGPK